MIKIFSNQQNKTKMKKSVMTIALIATTSLGANAQKLDASKVPAAVKASFAKQFPTAAAKWEKEDGKYEAGFKKGDLAMSALFSTDGTMTESEVSIKQTELPENVLAYVKENYKGKTIKESAKITKADGTVVYEAEVNGMDLIFDDKGKFIKAMKA